jgi:hypothetical protein
MFDSGSSAGEISGHSKVRSNKTTTVVVYIIFTSQVVNAVAIRHQRPFRAATASDDATIVFYHGVFLYFCYRLRF